MTYHTVLKESDDFVDALRYSRELSDNITQQLKHWPYNATLPNGATLSSGSATESIFPYR